MGGEGSIAAMIASLKNNNRRKNKIKPFSNYKKEYKKGKPISSKELTPQEKEKLLIQLKENRQKEKKLRVYKMGISLGLTVFVIGIIVFLIKIVFL
jgi:hypothetical protein